MPARKSKDAFRTISEVSEWLDTPAHVLRFWESRFPQVKPVKRAGGRRYYRPADMMLLGGIKKLLHQDGMTIRGAQKLLREEGIKHVSAMSIPLDGPALQKTDQPAPEVTAEPEIKETPIPEPTPDPETAAADQSAFFLEGGEVRAPEKPTPPSAPVKTSAEDDEETEQLDLMDDPETPAAAKMTPTEFRARLADKETRTRLQANPKAVQQVIVKLLALQTRMAGR
ncbi:MerR family transcriptional regulator [Actibacterium pelagium]|uniref:MerR family transcriptional regulator n=1 Tax=Actibacterium pelagium TaxID=2029103 RepID=A0A917ACD6_9RHOB|nr:MerR family transcriptional regulator [Actibacterium pelagium]GGE41022.1 MerR family transcriptional regulator [Actibacterium pelagium]